MNSRVVGLRVASVVFGLLGTGQLIRLLMHIGIDVGGRPVPMWFSGVAVLVLAGLCAWLWRLSMEGPAPIAPPPAT